MNVYSRELMIKCKKEHTCEDTSILQIYNDYWTETPQGKKTDMRRNVVNKYNY